jgi:hypothetical protein
MPDLSNYTNGQLLEIAKHPESEEWQAALDKLDERMTTANVKSMTELPSGSPPG